MRQSSISFKSKGVALEGVIAAPHGLSGALPGVVVCHPHPLFGGDMNNGVVLAVSQGLVGEGFVALRFNFRGVGSSEGSFTKGEEEPEDVGAALELLRQWPGVNRQRVGLAGYSFGASMVLSRLSRYKGAKALALISPPLTALDHQSISKDKRPKFFLVGERDALVPYGSLREKTDSFHQSVELRAVPGADHSWRGYEVEAAERVSRFFAGTL